MNKFYFMLSVLVFSVFVMATVLATPNGANFTEVKSETAPTGNPQDHNAYAGNVTEINVFGYSTTQSWQGYFGNVTGTIQLADGNSNVMYNWSLTNAKGEIYTSNQTGVSWSNIGCFDFYSTTEMNLSDLESNFNINSSDVDGVDETFNLNNHAAFSTGTTSFNAGQCNNTKLYNDAATGVFDEVLLYDSSSDIVVFASLLKDDTTGFDGAAHDFEMIVLEDGHGTDTSTTTYYFYVELA